MNIFDIFLVNPILNILVAFYKVFDLLSIPGALGFAIIFMTIAVRLALWPLTAAQLKSSQKMAALKPHLDRIKKDHGHDKARHQQEINKLYKDHGVNPLAGCLPLLLQIPVFIALYNVLLKIVEFGNVDFLANINSRLYLSFLHLGAIPHTNFIFNLASKPNEWQRIGMFILIIPIITGALQFVQSKMMMPTGSQKPIITGEKDDKKGKESFEDSMAQVSSQMAFIMPAMIAFFSYGFPIGLSLYWNTFTVVGIVQQYMISGPGSLGKYLPKKYQK